MTPHPFLASEQAPSLRATYAYIVEHPDAERMFWVKWDKPITIANLPAQYDADAEQLFTPCQIAHGGIQASERFEPRPTYLQVPSDDDRLRRFFSTAAAQVIRITIIRLSAQDIPEGETLDFNRHALVVFYGIASKFNFQGVMIRVEVTPEAHFIDRAVPRFFFSRPCNHRLFGPGCNLDKADFAWATTIKAMDAPTRIITLDGIALGAAPGHFEAGYFEHLGSNLNVSISWSDELSGDTRVKAFAWLPGMEVGDEVIAYPGCRHIPIDCQDRFNNSANFGGFAWVPAKNPTTQGV